MNIIRAAINDYLARNKKRKTELDELGDTDFDDPLFDMSIATIGKSPEHYYRGIGELKGNILKLSYPGVKTSPMFFNVDHLEWVQIHQAVSSPVTETQ